MIEDIEGMSSADLMHYAREQRKYIHTHYEKYTHKCGFISLSQYIREVYIPTKQCNKFHEEFFAKHRKEIDYTATVHPRIIRNS